MWYSLFTRVECFYFGRVIEMGLLIINSLKCDVVA